MNHFDRSCGPATWDVAELQQGSTKFWAEEPHYERPRIANRHRPCGLEATSHVRLIY